MKSKLLVLSTALMLVLAGCSGNNNQSFTPASSGSQSGSGSQSQATVTGVTLDKTELALTVGQTATLVATVTPAGAATVVWSSSSANATVDDGVVTAVSAGPAVITASAGGFTASCAVTISDPDARPADAVDLAYSTGENLSTHGQDYCYFNDPEWWSGASATVNEAYYSASQNKVVFDYTYDPASNPGLNKWSVQLNKENTSLVDGQKYNLSFKMKSNKAGTIVVNGADKAIVVGDNDVSITYTEKDLSVGDHIASFALQFPFQTFNSARVSISDITWSEPPTPSSVYDLEYATGADLPSHGDEYCYFNNPEWWEGGSATVNEANYNEGTITFDYAYKPESSPSCPAWSVQLLRENTSLVDGQTYTLTLNINSNKAGTIIVNNANKTLAIGDNSISVTYAEPDLSVGDHVPSFAIQFPIAFGDGSAKVIVTNVNWA